MISYKKAFTLIEVLISVIILSGSIVYVLLLHSQTKDEIAYIVKKNKFILADSLFVSSKTIRYHKDNKNAYDIIGQQFKINNLQSREILKNIQRDIFIPDKIKLKSTNPQIPNAQIQEIKIKGQYSSYYFHFDITSI